MAVASTGSLPPESSESSHLLRFSHLQDTPFASHEVRSPPSEPRDLSDRVLRSGRLFFRCSPPARLRSNIAVRPPSCLTGHCNRHSISSTSASFHLSGEPPSTLHLHGSPLASVMGRTRSFLALGLMSPLRLATTVVESILAGQRCVSGGNSIMFVTLYTAGSTYYHTCQHVPRMLLVKTTRSSDFADLDSGVLPTYRRICESTSAFLEYC